MKLRAMVVVVTLGTSSLRAGAEPTRKQEARQLFSDGSAAFNKQEYDRAYELFRKAYLLSQSSELLFNMSLALERAGKPHEAAEELRGYLRTTPKTPRRDEIEQRILTLEESQRLLEQERAKNAPLPAPAPTPVIEPTPPPPAPVVVPAPVVAAPEPTPQAAVLVTPPPKRSKRGLAIGLGIAGGVVVVAGVVVLGVLLSQSTPGPTASTFGNVKVTP